MVFQDGTSFVARDGSWRVPVVLNNLIAKKQLPVMAAVFVDPGQSPRRVPFDKAPDGSPLLGDGSRYSNRALEYGTPNSDYANFLLEEILPTVRQHVKLTDNPEGRGVGGFSSGGMCAFTVAWQHPEQFRKVFSSVGSFITIEGVWTYPEWIRTSERKQIRGFFQSGTQDRSLPKWGSGTERHEEFIAALAQKKYDYQFVFGQGTHSPAHAAAIFPEAMRWLWRDYPR